MSKFNSIDFTSKSLSFECARVSIDILEKNSKKEPSVSWNIDNQLFYKTDNPKFFSDLEYSSKRTTIITKKNTNLFNDNSLSLGLTEHLASVFLLWPRRSFNINVFNVNKTKISNYTEIPLLDGSAFNFFSALRKQVGTPESLIFYGVNIKDEWALKNENGKIYGSVRIFPSETFEVDYILDRPEMGDFFSEAHVSIYSAEDLFNVLEARTFIYESEYEMALKLGLLSCVDSSCGFMLYNKTKILKDCSSDLNKKKVYRVLEEPAMHKVLDLIGDLCFVKPILPKIRIEILNGGHMSHHEILERILPYVLQFRICT